jgi:hypothetical protein
MTNDLLLTVTIFRRTVLRRPAAARLAAAGESIDKKPNYTKMLNVVDA